MSRSSKKKAKAQINTKGGAIIKGDVSITGDFIGRDQVFNTNVVAKKTLFNTVSMFFPILVSIIISPLTCFKKDEEGYLYCKDISGFEMWIVATIIQGLTFIVSGLFSKHYNHLFGAIVVYFILSFLVAIFFFFVYWVIPWILTSIASKKVG